MFTIAVLMTTPGPIVQQSRGVLQTESTSWSPFGPRTDRLTITVYDDFAVMFDTLVRGEMDITDWPVQSTADENSFAANPDMYLTDGQAEFGIFDLEINHHNTFLGIPMQENRGSDGFNSPSTKQPTAAGIQIRKALAHLLDKPDFLNSAALLGRASYDDIQSPPLQGLSIGGAPPSRLPAAVLAEDCADHPWFVPCDATHPPVSAYNLVADSLPDPFASFADHGWSGSMDMRAACDHFVLAGISITPAGASCADVVSGTAKLVSGGQTIIFYIRTALPRKVFGTIILDAMNSLFDQPGGVARDPCGHSVSTTQASVDSHLCTFTDVVFGTDPDKDDWNLYTGGWFLGFFPDHFYSLYHSQFASNACGGGRSSFAQNYVFWCSPSFDQEASAGQSSSSFAEANTHFTNAALTAHRQVMTIPVYSGAGQKFVALNGWNFQPGTGSSLVSQMGHGFQTGFWSLLNMQQKPGYVSADPRYAPGGGDPNLIRRGLSQPVNKLSPFHALTLSDFEVVDQIYDTMLKINPLTAGVGQQVIDWMAVRHTSSFNPNTDVTTQIWTLRGDLRWHDDVPLTADDVAFSLIKYRDILPSCGICFGSPILDAAARDSRTVQVELRGPSPFHELNIGTLHIIPKHVWEPLGDAVMADPGFDPMATGKMIGSGPWICKNLDTGAVGGSCTRDANGNLSGQQILSGKIILTAYDGYARGRPGVNSSPLNVFSWADKNNDGKVDIVDIADVALHFGGPDQYWNTGQNPAAPQTIGTDASRVDIGEVANVAFYFEHGLVKPFSPSQVVGLDPDIDPFF